MAVRFGVFGTGHWAAEIHAAVLAASPDVELVGVWGRNPAKAAALAERYGARAYEDVDALVADVDAIDVALPPHVQAPIAVAAARAGRHLLLEKPLALTGAAAQEVVDAVEETGVSSVVFFTRRFLPSTAGWLAEQQGRGWHGAEATWLGAIQADGSPFGTPWRYEHGGLWDLGPHLLSMVLPLLGPVTEVLSCGVDRDDTARIVVRHEGSDGAGATSVLTAGATAPPEASTTRVAVYGPAGWSTMPELEADAAAALAEALRQLLAAIAEGATGHPCDVRFGAEVVRVLEAAEALVPA